MSYNRSTFNKSKIKHSKKVNHSRRYRHYEDCDENIEQLMIDVKVGRLENLDDIKGELEI